VLHGCFIVLIIVGFGYLKQIRIKEPPLWIIQKNHDQGTTWSGYVKKLESKNCRFQLFQKPQKPTSFHDRTNSFFGWICDFLTKTFENNNYISEWVFDFLKLTMINPKRLLILF
jgi:hypothetical protein